MTEGKIVSWLKQAGDKIKKGEVSTGGILAIATTRARPAISNPCL